MLLLEIATANGQQHSFLTVEELLDNKTIKFLWCKKTAQHGTPIHTASAVTNKLHEWACTINVMHQPTFAEKSLRVVSKINLNSDDTPRIINVYHPKLFFWTVNPCELEIYCTKIILIVFMVSGADPLRFWEVGNVGFIGTLENATILMSMVPPPASQNTQSSYSPLVDPSNGLCIPENFAALLTNDLFCLLSVAWAEAWTDWPQLKLFLPRTVAEIGHTYHEST